MSERRSYGKCRGTIRKFQGNLISKSADIDVIIIIIKIKLF